MATRNSGIAAALVCAAAASAANASLLAYEGFDYSTNSAVVGQSGGTGWTNSWYKPGANVSPLAVTPGLTFGNLAVTGNAMSMDDGVSNTVGSIGFRSAGTFNSGDVWVSFLVNPTNTTAAQQFFGLSFFLVNETTSVAGIQREPVGGGSVRPWAISGGGVASPNTGVNMTVGHTYFMVAHFAFDVNGARDRLDLFIDPTPGAALPSNPDLTLLSNTGVQLNWDRLRFGSTNSLGWVVDELRIGTTVVDVTPVPEPASIATLAMAGLGCMRRRRGTVGA